MINKNIKCNAFTLAEVLVTLGVIGVVAAMTIPSLISNYQKKTWTTQLQKSVATLNQGFRRMLADDNTTSLSQTETFLSIGGTNKICSYSDAIDSDNCKEFYTNLGRYFKIADIKKLSQSDNYIEYYLNGNYSFWGIPYDGTIIRLFDGTFIYNAQFYQNPFGNIKKDFIAETIKIDVNGIKKPNKIGRDIFTFYLGDNGILYPVGSQIYSEHFYDNLSRYWKTTNDSSHDCNNNGISRGAGCAARVLEEGKMNY